MERRRGEKKKKMKEKREGGRKEGWGGGRKRGKSRQFATVNGKDLCLMYISTNIIPFNKDVNLFKILLISYDFSHLKPTLRSLAIF